MSDSISSPQRPSAVYGPVPSWRFGRSLGIDPIVEISTCSFNCVYCQLGAIQRVTSERRVFVPAAFVREDLARVDWPAVDVVTFSGSGEPTLAINLAEMIAAVREAADRPIHMLTNATLFEDAQVRRDVAGCDVIACKLDAPSDDELQRINRPAPGITVAQIVGGIERLRDEFHGRMLLQVMLMPSNIERIDAWAPLIARMRPDEIQLNTPRRPYPAEWRLESRGDHDAQPEKGVRTALRVITLEQARQAESRLRELTGVPIVSVYRDQAPE